MGVISMFPNYYFWPSGEPEHEPVRIEPTVDYFHTLDPDQPQPFVDLGELQQQVSLVPSYFYFDFDQPQTSYTPTFLQPGQPWGVLYGQPYFGDLFTPSQLGTEPESEPQPYEFTIQSTIPSGDDQLLPAYVNYFRDPSNEFAIPDLDYWFLHGYEDYSMNPLNLFGPNSGPLRWWWGQWIRLPASPGSAEPPPPFTEEEIRDYLGDTGGGSGGGGSGYYIPSWQEYRDWFGRMLDRLASQWLSQLMGILGLGSTGAEAGPQIPDWLRRRMETQLYFPLFGIPQAP